MEGSTSHSLQVPKKEGESMGRFCKGLLEIQSQDKNFNEKSIDMLLKLLIEAFPDDANCPKTYTEVKKLAEEEEQKQKQAMKQLTEEEEVRKRKLEKKNKRKRMSKSKNPRVSWKNMDVVNCFLETCIQEVSLNGRRQGSLKDDSWSKLLETLETNYKIKASQKQCKNYYDYLKQNYKEWLPISQKAGNVFNAVTNTINFTPKEWDEYLELHPKAKNLRTSPLPFPALCTKLFDVAASTEVHSQGPSPKTPMPVSSSCFSTQNVELLRIEDIPRSTEDGGSPNPSTSHADSYGSQPKVQGERPKKKGKRHVSSIEEDLSKALKLLVKSSSGPTVDDCVEKLKKVGWGETHPLYVPAITVFCDQQSHRDGWMMIPENNTQLMEVWIKALAKKFGFQF